VGERNDIPGYRKVVREVRDAVDRWHDWAVAAELGDDVIERGETDMQRFRPL